MPVRKCYICDKIIGKIRLDKKFYPNNNCGLISNIVCKDCEKHICRVANTKKILDKINNAGG